MLALEGEEKDRIPDDRWVSNLSMTPMKGTALMHPRSIRLDEHGVLGDRVFYLVDSMGAHVSARQAHRLLLVTSRFDPASNEFSVTFPDENRVNGRANTGATLGTTIYGRKVVSKEVLGPFAEAISDYLDRPVRLATSATPGAAQDGEPVTLVSGASLAQISRWGGGRETLDRRRFRMTIEVDGCGAFEEDTWLGRDIAVGSCKLHIEEQVPRCMVINLDPDSGRKDRDLLALLAQRRSRTSDNGLPLGVYARIVQPGTIRVGDAVRAA